MNILAFETSCDETSAAIIQDGRRILTNVVASQIDLHKRWGGVVPELASRQHILYIVPTLEAALQQANLTWRDIDAIAVTNGPGLAGALLVGVNVAKGLAFALGKPLLPVNHIEGHIYANWLISANAAKPKPVVTELASSADAAAAPEVDDTRSSSPMRDLRAAYAQDAPIYRLASEPTAVEKPAPRKLPPAEASEANVPPEPQFPLIALVVSGGHTELILMRGHGQYELLGKTIDDAAGEAFDKVGRILGLGYPGGPAIQKLVDAEHTDPRQIDLPRAWLRGTYDFSFSGLKTAVMRKIDEYGGLPPVDKPRPFAEVEAATQQAAQQQRDTAQAVHPGQAPTNAISEPLAMPMPAPEQEQAKQQPHPATNMRPLRPVRSAPTQAAPPVAPDAPHTAEDEDDEADEIPAEPTFQLSPSPAPHNPADRMSGLFVRDDDELASNHDDEDEDKDGDEDAASDQANSPAPSGPSLERRPLRTVEAAPRPRLYSMFDEEDDTPPPDVPAKQAAASRILERRPLRTPPPPLTMPTNRDQDEDEDEDEEQEAATPPRPAAPAAPALERRPLRTSATTDPRAAAQPPTARRDDDEDDEDDLPLPRTLSPQGRNTQRPQPPQTATPQQGPRVFPPPAVLGGNQSQPRGNQQRPPQTPTPQRPNQPPPTQARPNQVPPPAQQRPNQPPTQQSPTPPPNQPQRPTQMPLTPPASPNRQQPGQPNQQGQPNRPFTRPGQLPQRGPVAPAPKPLAERPITPVPKGGSNDDDDQRNNIEDDDTPRSRVGSAADDDFEGNGDGGGNGRPRRTVGADAPRRPEVRGGVGSKGEKTGHAPVALIAAAFQLAVIEVLVEKTAAAAEQYGARQVLLAGGVAANRLLREMMGERLTVPLLYPTPALCTDNAAMIGAAAFYRYYHAQGASRDRADTSDWAMDIAPNAHFLGEVQS